MPISIEEKKRRGTYLPGRDDKPQAATPLTELPPVPQWIGDDGKRVWLEQGSTLLKAGLLSESDIVTFSRYCQYAGMFERLMKELGNEDLVLTLPNAITMQQSMHK